VNAARTERRHSSDEDRRPLQWLLVDPPKAAIPSISIPCRTEQQSILLERSDQTKYVRLGLRRVDGEFPVELLEHTAEIQIFLKELPNARADRIQCEARAAFDADNYGFATQIAKQDAWSGLKFLFEIHRTLQLL